MKDIIWTLIVVWLIYKIVELFKAATVKRSYVNNQTQHSKNSSQDKKGGSHTNRDMKDAIRRHVNKTGEYVDFEEIK